MQRRILTILGISALLLGGFILANLTHAINYKDGTLMRAVDNYRIYVIFNGKKRWVKNIDIFNSYGFNWGDIIIVNLSVIKNLEFSNLVRERGDTKVWMLNDFGYKRHLVSPEVFESYGFDWGDIVEVSSEEFNDYSESRLIRNNDDPKVYYLEDGKKRWVDSLESFYTHNFDWNEIQVVNEKDINIHETGEIIVLQSVIEHSSEAMPAIPATPAEPSIPAEPAVSTVPKSEDVIPTEPAIPAIPAVPAIPATPQPTQPQACTEDIWTCSSWSSCSASGQQTRTCTITNDCSVVTTPSPAITQSCTPPPPPDTTAPIISNIQVTNTSSSSVTIIWTTNESSTSQISYGITTSYGLTTILDSNLTTSHSVTISGLSSSTNYHATVISKDAAGNMATFSDQTFTTTTSALSISDVRIHQFTVAGTNYSSQRAHISWFTSIPTSSKLEYWDNVEFPSPGFAIIDNSRYRDHLETTAYLTQSATSGNVTWYYRITATDAAGNVSVYNSSFFVPLPGPPASTVRPTISGAQIQVVLASTPLDPLAPYQATVTWTANEPAYTAISWGLGTAVVGSGAKGNFSSLTINHLITIEYLKNNTAYNAMLKVYDADGNLEVFYMSSFMTPAS